jgi:FAD/FMN-containing dehydrogenase
VDAELSRALADAVGSAHVLSDPAVTVGYGTPWAAADGIAPAAVVRPADAVEAAAVLGACAAHGQPLVLQGGNTGLVRGGVPGSTAEIVLSTTRMTSFGEIDRDSLQVVVGAGVTLAVLQSRLDPEGLEPAIDLGARSQATLGGMAATNAGGARAFRHGTMRRQVTGVEAVLADGSVVERLGGVLKDSTGYDWPALLVGSEGSLALITRLRLRLRRVERSRAVALVPVDSLAAGLALAVALRDRPTGLEAAEFILPGALRLVCEEFGLRPPFEVDDEGSTTDSGAALGGPVPAEDPSGGAVVLFECRAPTGALDLLTAALAEHPGAEDAVLAEGGATGGLWHYREGIAEALAHQPVLKLDVALPLAALADGVAALERAALDAGGPTVRPYLFGHLLDGNVHVNLGGVDPDCRAAVERAVLETVLAHGGSIGAEHGIGRAKAPWLPRERSPADIAAMRALKSALDPTGLLAPGVLFENSP